MPSIKLKEIFSKNDENKLVLPDFQRDFVWDKEQQKNLLASFLTYLPVGSILLLDGKKDDFANKRMCFPKETCSQKDECTYLLDGQQRITSLKSVFTDLFEDIDNWTYTWENIFKDLRNRWFIRVIPKDGEEDIFGYKDLKFKNMKTYEPSEIINYIEYKQIFKTKTRDWSNPGFTVRDETNGIISKDDINIRNFIIAKYAAKEGLIPLYTLYNTSGTKALHEYVVERIARNRIEKLKVEIDDITDYEKRRQVINSYLKNIEPTIDLLIATKDEIAIENAWSNLGAKWSRDIINYLDGILNEEIPTIELPIEEINRAVAIFESINKGGTPLDTYDLVVAKAAKDKNLESLSKRLLKYLQDELSLSDAIKSDLREIPNQWYPKYIKLINDNELTKIIKNQFLNMLGIFSSSDYGEVADIRIEHIKKNKILKLSAEEINLNTEKSVKSIIRATAFLQLRCGVIDIKDIPYETMIIPIAYCLADDIIWTDKKSLDKIEYWYWACLFGGAYRERQNDQCIKDIKNLYNWIFGEWENPFECYSQKVLNEIGYSDKNLLLLKDDTHKIQNAIKKALLQYILSQEPKDFIYESLYLSAWKVGSEVSFNFGNINQLIRLENHHIYPLSNATKIGQSSKKIRSNKNHLLNSPLNRTYISSVSNGKINDMKPEDYFEYVSHVAQYGHCIATPIKEKFQKFDLESDEEFYERVLKDRYNEIYKSLVIELDKLQS
ncbi:DUF262 domain-containing protein [Clostridium haemolyticum]|uniref:GmrSD restriction endonucleases N-terminal domain-containing protein n=1 Tax=Clostridium haemolyticum NCTC 9693 TaxID=1443114 RepID=A0ABR4TDP0_CLOHA|nr:DUF262 domain-containing protein [Clostridium haemolyticum]KEI16032.1 hypothetical protein Z960_10860 [Clostridium haemolyticum NCTC 9693]KGN03639.1 hypothetical protein Z961_07145 [Clostridium haemolyticum NCTC 8350]CAG7840375.1 hypothetical protein CLOHAE12215_01799 [Clostridium haemolyticum]